MCASCQPGLVAGMLQQLSSAAALAEPCGYLATMSGNVVEVGVLGFFLFFPLFSVWV